jgi:uncharacterized membrane protein
MAASQAVQSNILSSSQIQHKTEVFQGPVPHPDILAGMDRVVPGSARDLIEMAKAEAAHQREMEVLTTTANIDAQKKQLEIADYQSKAVFRSDTLGQVAGMIVSLTCVGVAAYLAVNGHEWVAVVLAGIPTAAVIQAFFAKRRADGK